MSGLLFFFFLEVPESGEKQERFVKRLATHRRCGAEYRKKKKKSRENKKSAQTKQRTKTGDGKEGKGKEQGGHTIVESTKKKKMK
jgi:hypothetical protein